jgi:SulP family sulfate permease
LPERFFPFLTWGRGLDAATLQRDAVAGLIGAIIVLPQGVAFAALAGLPPEVGLYCAMVPTLVAALWGSSRHAVTGPTNAVSLVVFATLMPIAAAGSAQYIGFALTLAFMTGVLLLAVGLMRLGSLANFVSHTVVVGFMAGAGCLIAASQLNSFFGLDIPAGGNIIQILGRFAERIGSIQPWVAAVAVFTVAAGILSRRALPRMPYLLIALLAGVAAAALVNTTVAPAEGGLRMLSPLPAGLPSLSVPQFTLEAMQSLLAISLSIAVLVATESVSIGRALAAKCGQRFDPNQELVGQGLANIGGSFFSAYPAAASFNRSGANLEAGARSPMAAIFSVAFLAAMVVALAPLTAYIPYATLAGLLMLVAWGLIDFRGMRSIAGTSRAEAMVLALTFGATLLLSLEVAILVGVMASLVMYLNRTSHPAIRSLVPDPRVPTRKMAEAGPGLPECPQMKLLRIEGSIYFGAVQHVSQHLDAIREKEPQKHLLFMSKSINFVDIAGAELLLDEVRRRREAGGDAYFYSVRKPVEELLDRTGALEVIGRDHLFAGKREAFATVIDRLDPEICRRCTVRIYEECAQRPGGPQSPEKSPS